MSNGAIPHGFTEAILTNPDDDTPRLILADYLEERDDPRGEFIRLQCELARMSAACLDRFALEKRENDLLDAHRAEWFAMLGRRPGFGEDEPLRWWPVASNDDEKADRSKLMNGSKVPEMSASMEGRPTRGFVSAITCTAADFLQHADALYWNPEQNRPMPEGTQPLEEVTLTTFATQQQLRQRKWKSVSNLTGLRRQLDEVFGAEWPRLKFKKRPSEDMSELNALLEGIMTQSPPEPQPWEPLSSFSARSGRGPLLPRQPGILINSIT